MQPVLTIITAAAFAALAAGCGAGSGPPEAATTSTDSSPPTFAGKGLDSNPNTVAAATGDGTTFVSWRMTQEGMNVSGTMTTKSPDPMGTTCHSCHRSRTGALSGTISGTTLTWTATFPATPDDPTPLCPATLTGTISDITADSISGTYSGNDDCEGPYSNGTLTMARPPAPGP
jgi:hypothetical protein